MTQRGFPACCSRSWDLVGNQRHWKSCHMGVCPDWGCGGGTLPQAPEPTLGSSVLPGDAPSLHSLSTGCKLHHLVPKLPSLLGKSQHHAWSKISQSKQEGKQLPRSTDLSAV